MAVLRQLGSRQWALSSDWLNAYAIATPPAHGPNVFGLFLIPSVLSTCFFAAFFILRLF